MRVYRVEGRVVLMRLGDVRDCVWGVRVPCTVAFICDLKGTNKFLHLADCGMPAVQAVVIGIAGSRMK